MIHRVNKRMNLRKFQPSISIPVGEWLKNLLEDCAQVSPVLSEAPITGKFS